MTLFFPEDAVLYNNALEMISYLNDGAAPWCDADADLVQSMAGRIVELNRIILTQSIRIAELNRKPDNE